MRKTGMKRMRMRMIKRSSWLYIYFREVVANHKPLPFNYIYNYG